MEKERAEEERETDIERERERERLRERIFTDIQNISKHSVNKDYNYKPNKSPSI